jgi:hypothetical protein
MVDAMNKLSVDRRLRVISAQMEGASINSTVRMTGVSKPTTLKLIADPQPLVPAACRLT